MLSLKSPEPSQVMSRIVGYLSGTQQVCRRTFHYRYRRVYFPYHLSTFSVIAPLYPSLVVVKFV